MSAARGRDARTLLHFEFSRVDSERDQAEPLCQHFVLHDGCVVPNVDILDRDRRYLNHGRGEGGPTRDGQFPLAGGDLLLPGRTALVFGGLTSAMTIRLIALATLASTPTRSNSRAEGLSELSCTRSCDLKWSRSHAFTSPGWWPGKSVAETCADADRAGQCSLPERPPAEGLGRLSRKR